MLPVRPPCATDGRGKAFQPASSPNGSGITTIVANRAETRIFEWDVARETLTIRSGGDSGRWILDATGTEMGAVWNEVTQINDHDPTSARIDTETSETFARDAWRVRIEARLRMSLNLENFFISGEVKAFEHDREIFARNWDRTVPRELL
jgi:hypothetical protein